MYGTEEIDFSMGKLLSPPIEFSPVYSWIWNSEITEERIIKQIEYMHRCGIRVFYIIPCSKRFLNNQMEPDYLSGTYFALYRFALQYAKSKEMYAWIYDEDGGPSGGGNGRLVRNHPQLVRKRIVWEKQMVHAGEILECDASVLAVFLENTRIFPKYRFEVNGEITIFRTKEDEIYPDLLNLQTTRAFLSLVHESYANELNTLPQYGVRMIFTDEPSIDFPCWSDVLRDEFKKRFGYDLLDHLPLLLSGEDGGKVREQYFDIMSQLFAQNYFLQIKQWCKEHNILFTGHLDKDNDIYDSVRSHGQIMRLLRCFDVPGIDVIWRQIFPGTYHRYSYQYQEIQLDVTEGENRCFPRFASSAAHQTGSRYALSESFSAYGSGLTYSQMCYVLHFQVCRGINLINVMNIPSGKDGQLVGGLRPHFIEERPGAYDIAEWNQYAARLCYIMSCGVPEVKVLLYYPVRNFWMNPDSDGQEFTEAAELLENANVYFDIADDDLILNADLERLSEGKICAGYVEYDTVYLPLQSDLSEEVEQRLDIFKKNGGMVVVLREKADICSASVFLAIKGCENLRGRKTRTLDSVIYFIYNEGLTESEGILRIVENQNVYRLDITTGKYTEMYQDGFVTFKLRCGDGIILVSCDKPMKVEKRGNKELLTVISDFDVKAVKQFEVKNKKVSCQIPGQNYIKANSFDFKTLFGRDFSGDVVYRASFYMSEAMSVIIDVGEVEYSCEAWLNDESLGICIVYPFLFIADAVKGKNVLEIRVSNTAANQYLFSEGMKEFTKEELGLYHDLVLPFEHGSAGGGLKEPVKIFKYERGY